VIEEDQWRSSLFHLMYSQHGGSGLVITYADTQSMDLSEVFWFLQKLQETREAEVEALKKAK
jgi:hypothetical protein